jgi:hypothetical protein
VETGGGDVSAWGWGWGPVPEDVKQRVRDGLPDVLADWVTSGDRLLTPEGGWLPGPPESVGDWWSHVLSLLASGTERVAYHAIAIRSSGPEREHAGELAGPAVTAIGRLAAALLQRVADQVDELALLAEAEAFVGEVCDEDDGLSHASDALGSLLQAEIVCGEEQVPLPDSERSRAAVKVLAPLLAQAACVLYGSEDTDAA